MSGCWNSYLIERKGASLYLFEYDTLKKYMNLDISVIEKDSIMSLRLLKRFDLTYDNIKSLNWTITYP